MGQLDQPLLCAPAVECAPGRSRRARSRPARGQRRAVDRHECPGRPLRVDRVGVNLLADAGLADEQDSVSGRCEPPQLRRGHRQRGRQVGSGASGAAASSCSASSSAAVTMRNTSTCDPRNSTRRRAAASGPPNAAVDVGAVGAAQILNDEQVGAARCALNARVRAGDRRVGDREQRCTAGVARRRAAADVEPQPSIATLRGARRVSGVSPLPTTITTPRRGPPRQPAPWNCAAESLFSSVSIYGRSTRGGPCLPERR